MTAETVDNVLRARAIAEAEYKDAREAWALCGSGSSGAHYRRLKRAELRLEAFQDVEGVRVEEGAR